ncbi:cytochrome P450 monooxygenase [Penicillium argentinense]|uniref:Cytochrome P450 monooxygenase n=1 Tax=Penicillium argentinense TaxID=1131581 RepID=A0A9W9EZU1_9EURO|nr:cytochrome P450 monooxygenase [Penicillium argentinense]KAJ5091012.1 cytochrome P450 monooxygenase [Penicillium argentinense]
MSPAVFIGHAAQISLLAILFYAGWTITCNRYLHPLSSYPGPLLSTISRIPYIIAYTQGRLHLYVRTLHDLYGDVVRIAPDELSYRDEQAWKDIYGRSSNFAKDMRFYQLSKKAASVAVAPKVIHRRQKKAILPVRGEGEGDGYVDLTKWFNYVIFDFMAHELFGKPLGCLEEASYHPWVEVLFGTVKAWAFLAIPKFFPSAAMLLKPLVLFLCRDSLGHRDTKYRALSVHIPEGNEQKEPVFMAHVQNSSRNDPESVLLPDEMLPNYSFLMMAGSETTATLLSGCTFYLLKHPHSYQRLTAEVRQRFSAPTEIILSSLAALPYLHSVITETLRLYPPVPLGMPRTVPAGGAMISGRYVPEKVLHIAPVPFIGYKLTYSQTTVAVPSWASSRSPSNFSSPDQFIPERWLNDPPCMNNDKKAAMQPFSLGLRGCPGKSMAYMEAGLILARILWSFDLQVAPGFHGWDNQRAFLIWEKGPLLVRLTPRD